MSDYKLETKKQGLKTGIFPLSLVDYMIFNNQDSLNKSLVLKLQSEASFIITEIEIKIKQLDAERNVISEGYYQYKNLHINIQSEFIPKERILLDPSCSEIEYSLIKAVEGPLVWENADWNNHNEAIKNDSKKQAIKVTKIKYKELTDSLMFSLVILIIFIIIVIRVFYVINA